MRPGFLFSEFLNLLNQAISEGFNFRLERRRNSVKFHTDPLDLFEHIENPISLFDAD